MNNDTIQALDTLGSFFKNMYYGEDWQKSAEARLNFLAPYQNCGVSITHIMAAILYMLAFEDAC